MDSKFNPFLNYLSWVLRTLKLEQGYFSLDVLEREEKAIQEDLIMTDWCRKMLSQGVLYLDLAMIVFGERSPTITAFLEQSKNKFDGQVMFKLLFRWLAKKEEMNHEVQETEKMIHALSSLDPFHQEIHQMFIEFFMNRYYNTDVGDGTNATEKSISVSISKSNLEDLRCSTEFMSSPKSNSMNESADFTPYKKYDDEPNDDDLVIFESMVFRESVSANTSLEPKLNSSQEDHDIIEVSHIESDKSYSIKNSPLQQLGKEISSHDASSGEFTSSVGSLHQKESSFGSERQKESSFGSEHQKESSFGSEHQKKSSFGSEHQKESSFGSEHQKKSSFSHSPPCLDEQSQSESQSLDKLSTRESLNAESPSKENRSDHFEPVKQNYHNNDHPEYVSAEYKSSTQSDIVNPKPPLILPEQKDPMALQSPKRRKKSSPNTPSKLFDQITLLKKPQNRPSTSHVLNSPGTINESQKPSPRVRSSLSAMNSLIKVNQTISKPPDLENLSQEDQLKVMKKENQLLRMMLMKKEMEMEEGKIDLQNRLDREKVAIQQDVIKTYIRRPMSSHPSKRRPVNDEHRTVQEARALRPMKRPSTTPHNTRGVLFAKTQSIAPKIHPRILQKVQKRRKHLSMRQMRVVSPKSSPEPLQESTNETQRKFNQPIPPSPSFGLKRTRPSKPSFSSRTNKKLIKGAISNVCLAGIINEYEKQTVLDLMRGESGQFIILLAKANGTKYRGLYLMDSGFQFCTKLGGRGPARVPKENVKYFQRFDSINKRFLTLDVSQFSHRTDAIVLWNQRIK